LMESFARRISFLTELAKDVDARTGKADGW
jgi:hypothetical protein